MCFMYCVSCIYHCDSSKPSIVLLASFVFIWVVWFKSYSQKKVGLTFIRPIWRVWVGDLTTSWTSEDFLPHSVNFTANNIFSDYTFSYRIIIGCYDSNFGNYDSFFYKCYSVMIRFHTIKFKFTHSYSPYAGDGGMGNSLYQTKTKS